MKNTLSDTIEKHTLDRKQGLPKIYNSALTLLDVVASGKIMEIAAKQWHLALFVLVTLAVFGVYAAKSFNIQVLYGVDYKKLAFANKTRSFVIPAERGAIYDASGTILVRNKPSFSLIMDTGGCLLRDNTSLCREVVRDLSRYMDFDTEAALSAVAQRRPNIILKSGLSKEDILSLESKIQALSSISIITAPLRDYIYKDMFVHLIGYVGAGDTLYPTIVGKSGVEEFYNDVISGVFGRRVVQTDAFGSDINSISVQDAVGGKNVTLYVNVGLQKLAYEELKNSVVEKKAVAGAVVAQDPRTGGVLALVSYPAFDPDALSLGVSKHIWEDLAAQEGFPFFNRVLSATYPPGSTFKPVTAAAALSEAVIKPYTEIFDPGFIQIGSYVFRNWKLDGHGDVNIFKALQVSNDTYFYTVGGLLGIQKLSSWARKFGFGVRTGIDLWGEVSGFMPDGTNRDWYLGDTYITAIGQGDILATPLQVNNMFAYFANGGYLMVPHVVKNVWGNDDTEVEILAQNLVSPEVYAVVREGLRLAVGSGGTGYTFFDFSDKHSGVEVAGKTGTSEYIDASGEEKTHAWFSVFGPFNNADIVLTVFLEGGGSGSDDAGPIARKLMDYWFSQLK